MTTAAVPAFPAPELPREGRGAHLFTRLSGALDRTVLAAVQRAVDALLMPPPEELPALLASARGMVDPALLRDPAAFFAFGAPAQPIEVRSRVRRGLEGGDVTATELVVRYRPHAGPDEREERIVMEQWRHRPARRRPTLVALHGFTMGQPRIDAVVLCARHWYRLGLDVALLTLPHHGARTPADAHFSGEPFTVPDVARFAEGVRQAVFELGVATRWLRDTQQAPVGVLGLSLGGYVASLAAALHDDLAFAVPVVPPACIGDLAWRFFQRSRHTRRGAAPAFGHEELRALYRVHSPLAHPLRLPRERVMIVAGRGDHVVPPEHPHALWLHWGRPRIHWFSGSHLAPFGRGRMVSEIASHLSGAGVL